MMRFDDNLLLFFPQCKGIYFEMKKTCLIENIVVLFVGAKATFGL